MNKKIILLLVVVVIGVAIGGYFLFFAQKQSGTSLSSSPSEKLKDILGIQPSTKNWQTYKNNRHGFSIKYPAGYTSKEREGSGPTGPVFQVIFVPVPEDKPDEWTGVPLSVMLAPDANFEMMQQEFEKQKEGAEYYEETLKTVAGVNGMEVKIGPSPSNNNIGNNQHAIYITIPFVLDNLYQKGYITFLTFAFDKNQLEKEAAPSFDAFLSTFKTFKPE